MIIYSHRLLFLLLGIMLKIATGTIAQNVSTDNVSFYDVSEKEFYNLEELLGDKGLVLLFTSLYCPYAEEYENRLVVLFQQYQSQGINMVLVNSNNPSVGRKETIEGMRSRALQLGLMYTSDQSQLIKNTFNASKNGEVIVLTKAGDGYKVFYQGAFDDNPLSEENVNNNYLKLILDDLVSGAISKIRNVRPVGCRIR